MYTKGEWKVSHNKHGWHCDVDGVGRVCMIDTEANANLIAATPDLYKALKNIVERHERGLALGEELDLEPARKAITRAEGGQDVQSNQENNVQKETGSSDNTGEERVQASTHG